MIGRMLIMLVSDLFETTKRTGISKDFELDLKIPESRSWLKKLLTRVKMRTAKILERWKTTSSLAKLLTTENLRTEKRLGRRKMTSLFAQSVEPGKLRIEKKVEEQKMTCSSLRMGCQRLLDYWNFRDKVSFAVPSTKIGTNNLWIDSE
jgi:hypothetical protein